MTSRPVYRFYFLDVSSRSSLKLFELPKGFIYFDQLIFKISDYFI